MQPSSAFSILKQLSKTGKWKILDKTLSSVVAHDPEPVADVIAPLSDSNRDKTVTKELTANVRKLKSKGSELDAMAVGNFDNILNVDKENVHVQGMSGIDSSVTTGQIQSERIKHNLFSDEHRDRTGENVDEIYVSGGYDAVDVKLCHIPKQHRRTFSLGTKMLSFGAVQLPVQSDSIDVVSLIGEVADVFQRSSDVDTEDISTQEIEAHEDKFDSFKQHHSSTSCTRSVVPVGQHAVQDTSLLSVNNVTQLSELILEPVPPALSAIPCTRTGTQVSDSVLQCLSVKAQQFNDVPSLPLSVPNGVRNSSSTLPNSTGLDMVSATYHDHQQVYVSPTAVAAEVFSESPAETQHDETYTSATDVVANKICETKQSYCMEQLSSQVVDASDVDSESGE